MGAPSRATIVLRRLAAGDAEARDELLPLVYDELHRIAGQHMRRQAAHHTLQPTALVHEAWLRLAGSGASEWADREHFLSFASRVMRTVLVDHARGRDRAKRGGGMQRVPLDVALDRMAEQGVDMLVLDEALRNLAEQEPDLVAVVELRFFGGLTMEQVARSLDVSLSTAERNWRLARVWLRDELGDQPRSAAGPRA